MNCYDIVAKTDEDFKVGDEGKQVISPKKLTVLLMSYFSIKI